MTQRDKIIQWTAYAAALVFVSGAERLVLSHFPVLGVVPVLLPLALCACAALEGPQAGAGFGIAVGIFMTAAAGGGFWRLAVCSAAGFLCGLITRYGLPQAFIGHLVCSSLVMAVRMVWCVVSRLVSGSAGLSVLLRVAVPEFLWSMVFSIPIYLLFRFVCEHWGSLYHS